MHLLARPSRRTGGLFLATVIAGSASAHRAPDMPGPAAGVARSAGGASRAYGIWTPARPGECSKTIHDRYSTLGPDGKLYPTWHPPLDPSGCSFGHDHGRDPRGSALYPAVGDIPFGYADEVLADSRSALALARHQDHAGHTIEWQDGVTLPRPVGGQRVHVGVRCDVLVKTWEDSRTAAAETARVREIAYHLKCDDRTEFHLTFMSAAADAGLALDQLALSTPGGTTAWYTDPFGSNARPLPFGGSIRQTMALVESPSPPLLLAGAHGAGN